VNPTELPQVELDELVGLFFPQSPLAVGAFHEVDAAELPADANSLLNHCEHMTVTIEDFHGSEVDVTVLEEQDSETHYSRKILLTRKSDGGVVQFGIVRLDMSTLPQVVQDQIRERKIPLGRILISHDVMRAVRLAKLYRFEAGEELASHFGVSAGTNVFGRTAWMYCNGKPAIELLEIVNLKVV
jgi:chorismate-pyruvate lyase